MTAGDGPTILIVAEHPVVRAGLRALLAEGASLEVVAEASTIDEAVDVARRLAPRVVVLAAPAALDVATAFGASAVVVVADGASLADILDAVRAACAHRRG